MTIRPSFAELEPGANFIPRHIGPSEAEGSAWFMKVKLSNPAELDELMDKAAYDKLVNG